MTRHSKNCTAHTVYTYYERKKDASRSGYGTQEVRLAKDPVVTPDGYVYDRAVILEYMLNQKAEIQRKLKLYEKQKLREANESRLRAKAEKDEKARQFLSLNTLDTHAKASAQAAEAEVLASLSSNRNDKPPKLACFWVSDSSTHGKEDDAELSPPDKTIRCPMSGKPLRYKDLTAIKFTTIEEDNIVSTGKPTTQELRYYCAVSKDPLTNATPCVVLKTSGSVVTREVVEKIIKKEMVDPINGQKMSDSDFIELQRGSLGFADDRVILTAKRHRPSMQT